MRRRYSLLLFVAGLALALSVEHAFPQVTNQPGARKIDILDNTQEGLDGDEPSIGFIEYNQVGNGDLRVSVKLQSPPSGSEAFLPCVLQVQLVTSTPAGFGDWPTGGIDEATHFGSITVLGNISVKANGVGHATFKQSTGPGAITGAQVGGLRNYGHINIEDTAGCFACAGVVACGMVLNQVGASRVEWISQ